MGATEDESLSMREGKESSHLIFNEQIDPSLEQKGDHLGVPTFAGMVKESPAILNQAIIDRQSRINHLPQLEHQKQLQLQSTDT
jgi:hypothetical protein